MTRFQCIKQMKSLYGSPGSIRLIFLAGDNQYGTTMFFHDARRGNPDHAPVPAFAVDDNAKRIANCRFFREPLFDAFDEAALFVLPLGIELIEPPRDLPRAVGVFDTEQFDYVAGSVHATGGVETRRDAEANFGGGERAAVREFSNFNKR